MCGIAGMVGTSPEARRALERMTERLAHRGPDDSGVWSDGVAHLGHTRLSILDLSEAGHQPMVLRDLALTYNGEIYNFHELRDGLDGPFRSDSDTEVLLHLFAKRGASSVEQLHGMFAFAIWNSTDQSLFAARDRLGIKPFYYRELEGGGLAFASEIKALLELGRPEVDRTALRDYLTYKCAPPPKTVYQGIHQLPPGHTLSWSRSTGLRIQRYWNPALDVTIHDVDEALEQLEPLLARAIREHTLSDVPVGVFLSGGVDSATVVAHLDRPRTFTLGLDVKHRDESGAARAIANHFETQHREVIAGSIDLERALDTIPAVFDEPFGDTGAWSSYLVSEMAAKEVKVCLNGEGGDELFAGYNAHSKFFTDTGTLLHRLGASLLPPFTRAARSCQRRSATGLARYAAYVAPFTLEQKRDLLGPELDIPDYDDLWHVRQFWREDLEPLKRLLWAGLNSDLPGFLLTKVDRPSMAHSLEVRPPFLDHRLVEFALSLAPEILRDVPAGQGKLPLRRLMKDRVPPGHFDAPKGNFSLPVGRWLSRDPGKMNGALDRLDSAGLIRRPKAPRFSHLQAWNLLVLDRWMAQNRLY